MLYPEGHIGEDQIYIAAGWHNIAMHIQGCLPSYIETMTKDKKGIFIPTSLSIAHAFGEVFDLQVVDGKLCYIHKTKLQSARIPGQGNIVMEFGLIKHSWVEFYAHGRRMILDVFPKKNSSLFSLLMPHPHPAYCIPPEKEHREAVEKKLNSAKFKEEMLFLVSAMREIARDYNLQPPSGS